MLSIGPKYQKLKSALELARIRLRILQNKDTELNEKSKKDVATYWQNGKYFSAKLKAHRIIRNEKNVEAMEILEFYCESILQKYDILQCRKEPDENLMEAISSLIWASPHFQDKIKELKDILRQFSVKYGSRFCREALLNSKKKVNENLIERVRTFMPPDDTIDKYIREICLKHGILYHNEDRVKRDNDTDELSSEASKPEMEFRNETEFVAESIGSNETPLSSKSFFRDIMARNKKKKRHNNTKGLAKDKSKSYKQQTDRITIKSLDEENKPSPPSTDASENNLSQNNLASTSHEQTTRNLAKEVLNLTDEKPYHISGKPSSNRVLPNVDNERSNELPMEHTDPPPSYDAVVTGTEMTHYKSEYSRELQVPTCPSEEPVPTCPSEEPAPTCPSEEPAPTCLSEK